jgi:hypothetical protein
MTNWKVSNYFKKSCEEHEIYVKDNLTIKRITGYRGASFFVETLDENPPDFEFTFVPGGDGKKDSIDMYNCYGNNIDNVELESMWDGCWEEVIFPEEMDQEEKDRLQSLIDEEGIYEVLENQEGWVLTDTEAWIWGPILIEDEAANQVRIIVADEDGNVVDYQEKQ